MLIAMGRCEGRSNVTGSYEFARPRPEAFACFECGGLTAIDENNRTMPHVAAGAACGAVGRRVMVRWPEEVYRCGVCHVAGLATEAGPVPAHGSKREPCPGTGLDAIRWKTLVPGNGAAGHRVKVAPGSEAGVGTSPDGNSKRIERASRLVTDRPRASRAVNARSGVFQRAAEKRSSGLSGAARRQVSVEEARLKRQLMKERDAAFREQVQSRKRKGSARGTPMQRQVPYIRVVSGGLPGSARRH